jgi:hypothetical protein
MCNYGGAFYNPQVVQFPNTYLGNYFFADFCGGWIKALNPSAGNSVSDFAMAFPRRSISKFQVMGVCIISLAVVAQ